MRLLLLACAGGALGSGARHLTNLAGTRLIGPGSPYAGPAATLTVNIVGSLLMGLLISVLALRFEASTEARTFLATGVLGGFTTFSAFSLDAVSLYQRGETALAVGYVALSVGVSIAALAAGLALGRLVTA